MKTGKSSSETKEKLLQTAERLMLSKGFVATTLDEVCKEAGLTKGSLFHYFDSKEALAKAVLQHFFSDIYKIMKEMGLLDETDPLKRIYGYIDFFMHLDKRPNRRQGCLLGNFVQVLSDTHPVIRDICADHFDWWIYRLTCDFDDAKEKYPAHVPFDSESLAQHFIATYEGALILAKAKQDISIIEKIYEHLRHYVDFLFNV